jgi:hypothetical protein
VTDPGVKLEPPETPLESDAAAGNFLSGVNLILGSLTLGRERDGVTDPGVKFPPPETQLESDAAAGNFLSGVNLIFGSSSLGRGATP